MDYEEKVIALLNSQELSKEQKEKLENIFPELKEKEKESEDERMKQEIIAYINELADLKNEKIPTKWIAWLEKQGQVKESHISQHESETCEENNKFLTNEDERIKETLKGFVKGYSAFINGQWRLGDFTVDRLIAWLEKQGEQNPVKWSEEDEKIKENIKKHIFNADDWYVSKVDGKIHNAKFIEKQDGEKPTDDKAGKKLDADKVIEWLKTPII